MQTSREVIAQEPDRLSRALQCSQSAVEQVRPFLRKMIVSGKLVSGERVVESRMARQLGIG